MSVTKIPVEVHPAALIDLNLPGRSFKGCKAKIVRGDDVYHVFPANPANIGYTLVRDRDRKTFGLYRVAPGSVFLRCADLFGENVFRDDGSKGFRLGVTITA